MRARPRGITRVLITGRGRDLCGVAVFRAVMWVEHASWTLNHAAVHGGAIATNLGS